MGSTFSRKVFSYSKGLEFYCKGIRSVDDMWDTGKNDFLPLEETQSKFNLTATDVRKWEEITNKLSEEWKWKFEEEADTTYPGKWLELCEEMKEDPTLVLRRVPGFTPSCFQFHNMTLPIPYWHVL